MIRRFFTILCLTGLVWLCSGWGFLVHRTINQLAVYALPRPMRFFFFENRRSLAENAPRPDQRRSTDPTEGSKHFIDLEAYGDSAAWKMPLHWEDAVRQYGRDTLLKYGYVPYQVQATKDQLTRAFRAGNRDSILFYAADLGHYIADAHVPLHTTINYDGQLTNQRGIHDLWETSVPELAMDSYRLTSRHQATYLPDPAAAIWQSVRESHALLDQLFSTERDLSRSYPDSAKYRMEFRWGKERRFYSQAFTRDYNARLGATINRQLIRSAEQVADFWYTAWVDAGKPDLSGLLQTPVNPAQKKALRRECRAFRHNQLEKKGLLVARQVRTD
ncbi:MAG TPA: zinc dependent phospholipase C family protein [Chitinophagaceae bacterium]|nr:zinc dependent phospholipase C family protein [Chitinophagaceae bacterium]